MFIFDLWSKIGCISEIQRKTSFPLVFRSICTIFARRTKRKRIMTAITINIPNHEVSFFKKMMEKMGWTYSVAEPRKPRLYDPETGEYLNDETMQAIEDVRSGKEPVYEMKSMDEFKAWCEAL